MRRGAGPNDPAPRIVRSSAAFCSKRSEDARRKRIARAALTIVGRFLSFALRAEDHCGAPSGIILRPCAEACATRVAGARERQPRILHLGRKALDDWTSAGELRHPRDMVGAEHEAELQRMTRAEHPSRGGRRPGEQILMDSRAPLRVNLGEANCRDAKDAVGFK